MKKWIAIYVIVFVSICLYGQSDTIQQTSKSKIDYCLVMDRTTLIQLDNLQNLQLDSLSTVVINPKWIKKLILMKDERYKYIYGDTGGRLYIYPKRRFKKDLKNLLENYKMR
jgi:hypothetical protein